MESKPVARYEFSVYEIVFNKLRHDYIWEALAWKGVSDKLVNLIKAQYDGFMCRILSGGRLFEPIYPNAGVI